MEVAMPRPARTALVLQGGGALGAYELGAARRLYKDEPFAPDIICLLYTSDCVLSGERLTRHR